MQKQILFFFWTAAVKYRIINSGRSDKVSLSKDLAILGGKELINFISDLCIYTKEGSWVQFHHSDWVSSSMENTWGVPQSYLLGNVRSVWVQYTIRLQVTRDWSSSLTPNSLKNCQDQTRAVKYLLQIINMGLERSQ